MPRPTKLIAVHKTFPKQLFRVNNGPQVQLRAWQPGGKIYDIFAPGGRVEPKALDPVSYVAPNGASMRPNSPYQQSLVSWRFKGADTTVYAIPQGTAVPEDLILVHERSDHYSLQPATTMSIHDLNFKITEFFRSCGSVLTREQWLQAYPKATENSKFVKREGFRSAKGDSQQRIPNSIGVEPCNTAFQNTF